MDAGGFLFLFFQGVVQRCLVFVPGQKSCVFSFKHLALLQQLLILEYQFGFFLFPQGPLFLGLLSNLYGLLNFFSACPASVTWDACCEGLQNPIPGKIIVAAMKKTMAKMILSVCVFIFLNQLMLKINI